MSETDDLQNHRLAFASRSFVKIFPPNRYPINAILFDSSKMLKNWMRF